MKIKEQRLQLHLTPPPIFNKNKGSLLNKKVVFLKPRSQSKSQKEENLIDMKSNINQNFRIISGEKFNKRKSAEPKNIFEITTKNIEFCIKMKKNSNHQNLLSLSPFADRYFQKIKSRINSGKFIYKKETKDCLKPKEEVACSNLSNIGTFTKSKMTENNTKKRESKKFNTFSCPQSPSRRLMTIQPKELPSETVNFQNAFLKSKLKIIETTPNSTLHSNKQVLTTNSNFNYDTNYTEADFPEKLYFKSRRNFFNINDVLKRSSKIN